MKAAVPYSKLTVVESGRRSSRLWQEIWEYRELLYLLAWRSIAVRYRQTVLGLAWAVFRPVVATLVLVAVFALFVRVSVPGAPHILFVLAGLLPWQLLSSAVATAAESLIENESILSKVYFPRALFPVSSVAAAVVDFLVGCAVLIVLMVVYAQPPTWRLLAFAPLLALTVILAVGAGLWLSAACVRVRDIRYVIPFAVQIGLYASPVAYPLSLVPERWQLVYSLNPAVGVIEGFRWALLGHGPLSLEPLAFSAAAAGVLLVTGAAYFRSIERGMVDIL